ncbi:MAG: GtrA family protein [Oscillospiraceae bacterium]|jgi:putative flippase GtrA|nr:GtrA family protein [Oscillospiraceae bacterium]
MKRFLRAHRELLLYMVFGALTTAVNMAAVTLLEIPGKALLGQRSYWLSAPVAWTLAVAFAYVTNKLFVFAQKSWAGKTVSRELSAFVAARLLSLALQQGLMALLFDLLQPRLLPKFEATRYWRLWNAQLQLPGTAESVYRFFVNLFLIQVLVVVLNYAASKLFIFKKKDGA